MICEDETVFVVIYSISSKSKNEIGSTMQTVCTSSTKSSAKKFSIFSIGIRLNCKQMCFLRKITTKNIDRMENEADELVVLFDKKIACVAISVFDSVDFV